jgi:hypothetical protein
MRYVYDCGGVAGKFVIDTCKRKRYPILHFRLEYSKYRKCYYSVLFAIRDDKIYPFHKQKGTMTVI